MRIGIRRIGRQRLLHLIERNRGLTLFEVIDRQLQADFGSLARFRLVRVGGEVAGAGTLTGRQTARPRTGHHQASHPQAQEGDAP